MRNFLRKYWFKLGVVLAIALPAVVTQTIKPIIGFAGWEIVADKIYSTLLSNQKPAAQQESSVVIVEVEQRTIAKYGWPIDREQYAQFFEKIKNQGHPDKK
jgi:CHASE2 domain-containing sensor protein